MKTLEEQTAEIMAEAQAKIEKAKRECAILEILPKIEGIQLPHVFITKLYGQSAWLTYKCLSAKDVVKVLESFKCLPCYKHSKHGVSIQHNESGSLLDPYGIISIDKYSQEVEFFANIGNEAVEIIVKVVCELPIGFFGGYVRDNPKAKINYKLEFKPNSILQSERVLIRYASLDYRGENSTNNLVYPLSYVMTEWLENGIGD